MTLLGADEALVAEDVILVEGVEAGSLEPDEVQALVTLVDRLPQLITHLDEDILPILETLGDVGPNLSDLVDTVQDMRQVVKGFPGSRLFRRRGAEEIAEEEAR